MSAAAFSPARFFFYLARPTPRAMLAGPFAERPVWLRGRAPVQRLEIACCFAKSSRYVHRLGVSESIVERAAAKGRFRGVLSPAARHHVSVFFLSWSPNELTPGPRFARKMGVLSYRNTARGLRAGLRGRSSRRPGGDHLRHVSSPSRKRIRNHRRPAWCGLGGTIFDPIAMATKGGAPSVPWCFALVGIATCVSMGRVESALNTLGSMSPAGRFPASSHSLQTTQHIAASTVRHLPVQRILRA